MKRIIHMGIILLTFSTSSYADENKNVALKIGVPGSIMIESSVSNKLSLGLEIAGTRFYPESSSYDIMNNGGVMNSRAIGARATWQPKGVFNRGAYLTGWVDYLSFDYSSFDGSSMSVSSSSLGTGSTIATGVIIGFQYLYDSDFILNFGAGYGVMKGTEVSTTKETTTYDTLGNILSISKSPSTDTLKTTDIFIFDAYIGYLF